MIGQRTAIMKIAKKKVKGTTLIKPAITLARPEIERLKTGQYLTLKCQNTPGDANSTKYDLSIPYFGTGTPEEWLMFQDNLLKGIAGQNITEAEGKYKLIESLLIGDALTVFNTKSVERGRRTDNNFSKVLMDLTTYIFPKHAYREQRRYMRRFLKKPESMPVRTFVSRVQELNNYLLKFPTETNGIAESIDQDELIETLYHAMPEWYRNLATVHGFNYVQHSIQEMIEFFERFENTSSGTHDKSTSSSTSTKKSKKRKVHFSDSEEDSDNDQKVCLLHGKCAHTTEQCEDLKRLIREHRASRKLEKQGRFSSKKKNSYRKSTYDKKSSKKQKHEVNALVEKKLKKLLKKNRATLNELQHFDQIKLSDSDQKADTSSSSSSSEDGEMSE